MRKLYIGIISLAIVLVIYLLYSRFGTTPPPDIARNTDFVDKVEDGNVGDFENQVGMIGDVGVGTVQVARYITRDENQQVERIWGFEKLLHKTGEMWELEKPYMDIYKPNFICYITADAGRVHVETAVGKSTPKDATFTSNVVVHIVPYSSSSIKESHIYLDDISFLSEKSLLSTDNSVRFVSEDARMLGRGLELVYDDLQERVEYLWIFELVSLHIKNSQTSFLSRSKNQPEKPADTGGMAETQEVKETLIASERAATRTSPTQSASDQKKADSGHGRADEYYKCLFSTNVLIDGPEQLIYAQNEVIINDILWSRSSESQPGSTEVDTGAVSSSQPDNASGVAENPQDAGITDTSKVTAAKPSEPNESPDRLQDIVVTCDNGFIIALKDSPGFFEKINKNASGITKVNDRGREKINSAEGRKTFFAQKIDYNRLTDDVIATGESELKFYTTDLGQADSNQPPLPVTVTSRQKVSFMPTSNLAVFEGDCRCEMLQTDPNFQLQYTLLAPRLTVNLTKGANDSTSASTPGIEHFTADGGLVRLQSRKTAGQQLLGWTKLESSKFDYDPIRGLFLATGPGIIELDNSKASVSEAQPGKFSLSKPCYAVVREYETLKYFIRENRIVADAPSEGLIIDYFPVVNGKTQFDQQAAVYTPHIQADLVETASGESELSSLSATGGIVYKDQDKQFDGSTLFYDAEKSVVTVKGDEFRPCQYNGAKANSFEWDLKTNKVKTGIAGPAIMQLK